jgi:hypothetical protein
LSGLTVAVSEAWAAMFVLARNPSPRRDGFTVRVSSRTIDGERHLTQIAAVLWLSIKLASRRRAVFT